MFPFVSALIQEITITRKILRQFAWVMGVMLGLVIPLIIFWVNDWQLTTAAMIVFTFGLLFVITGLAVPGLLRRLYIAWMLLALVLGSIVTRIIITTVFYLMITPVGVIRRWFGTRDLLGLQPDPEKKSYWITRDEKSQSGQMKKQY